MSENTETSATERTFRAEDGWVIDDRNNRASIECWGSEGKAKASLLTLTNCYECYDCSGCYRARSMDGKKDVKVEGGSAFPEIGQCRTHCRGLSLSWSSSPCCSWSW